MSFDISSYTDIHTHILPGIDDGCASIEESVAVARQYALTGVKKIIATPHFLPGTVWATPKEKVIELAALVQTRFDQEHIDVEILPGMEIAYHAKLPQRIEAGEMLTLGNSSYYLIEPSFHDEQDALLDSLAQLGADGHNLILAHPERIDGLRSDLVAIRSLVRQGVMIQVNSGSLLGHYGSSAKAAAYKLWNQNCCHFIASDMHSIDKRGPLNHDEWQILLNDQTTYEMLQNGNRNLGRIFRRIEA